MSSVGSTPSDSTSASSTPRVGGVRCYWAVLAPRYPNPAIPGSKLELVFVHPDPVLGVHLARQKLSLMGRGVLEFIHPAEREQARLDLSNAIASDDLQGSVTRVRFARLTWIRKVLGGKPEEVETPHDASTFVEDDEYLILDLVLNWVADGMLLAFFHAIRDKDPKANNDPQKQHEEWSNYCGTAMMGEDQIEALHESISAQFTHLEKSRFPPRRVFQLHTSSTSPVLPNSLIFTWPPARLHGSLQRNDGLYDAEEYAAMMRGVDMDPSQHKDQLHNTNCTTRYSAAHSLTTEGIYRHVTSVFIPYGSLIFACFQTIKAVDMQPRPMPLIQPVLPNHPPTPAHSGGVSANGGSASMPASGTDIAVAQSNVEPYGLLTPHQEWNLPPSSDWTRSVASSKQTSPVSIMPSPTVRQEGFEPPYYPSQLPSYPPQPPLPPLPPAQVPPYPEQQRSFHDEKVHFHPPAPITDINAYPTPAPSVPYITRSPPTLPPIAGAAQGGAPTRPLVRPPGNVECCRMCGLRESPEWRRSETGIKDLCNACGLKLARQVAKREGRQKPRKKKDKET